MEWVIGILLDLVLLAIVFLCYRKGAKDGFAKTLVSLLGFVIAIVAASVLCAPVSNFVYDNLVQKPIETTVYNIVEENLTNAEDTVAPQGDAILDAIDEGISKLPAFIRNLTDIENKKDQIVQKVNELVRADAQEISTEITATFIRPVVIKVLSVLVFIVLFFVVWIACKLLAKALKIINKIPLLGQVNALFGGLIGIVKGLIVALIISWVIVMIVGEGGSLFGVISSKTVESSLILKTISTYNPLNLIIAGITQVK